MHSIYISLCTESAQQYLVELQRCVMSVFNWMTQTKVNLNPSKTEFLLIWSEFQQTKFSHLPLFQLLITEQTQQILQRDLGVIFDNKFSQDISCSACFYHIWDIRCIRKGLPLALAEQIAVALVASKLDYCNSLLHNILEKNNSMSKIIWLG